ncbi:hypothetical protein PR001_g18497 [Phytophthora rubi]|uniref:Uncharacterized protein n=1 Tax=Phytophthora rubi TaxID=129364 RepID=A0A6A3KBX5_9STRA|nr:hypothetical protein PR001_g18497 [Phytophthora rubi]
MGDNFNTPFDDVVSVGAEEEDDEDDDGDFEEDESDDEELDPSESDDTALASDPSRLESSLELLSASEPEALGPTDPELEPDLPSPTTTKMANCWPQRWSWNSTQRSNSLNLCQH